MSAKEKDGMLKKVKAYVDKQHMLEHGDKVVVGVSGGADSVCLLFVLLKLQKEYGCELTAVHVNHGLRGADADADEEYVKELCRQYGIPCRIYHVNVELIAKNRQQSMEEAGRDERRRIFYEVLKDEQADKIALAHHKNDNVETMIMNLVRGSGMKGMGGMKPANGCMIRPLLCLERWEIEQYLEEENLTYCTDKTNASDDYTRNRIRNHIIPYFEQELNPKAVSHIDETMSQLRLLYDYMGEQSFIYYQTCVENNLIRKNEYEKIPHIFRLPVIQKALAELAGSEKDLGNIHFQSISKLMEKQVGKRLDLPYGICAIRCYEGIRLEKKQDVTCVNGMPDIRVEYRLIERSETMEVMPQKTYTKWFDYDIIKGNLCVRTRMPGDYITIDHEGNRQKLKSYFINEKIPSKMRDSIPLIADGSHILWIIGHRMSSAYQIQEHTKRILEIKIDGGEERVRED